MGVVIRGCSIPNRIGTEDQQELKELLKIKDYSSLDEFVYVYAEPEFFRTLKKSEETYRDLDNDKTISDDLEISYSFFNQIKRELSRVFLSKTVLEVWAISNNLKMEDRYPHPLFHLINFPDNEGYIGPTAVRELSDFFSTKNIELLSVDQVLANSFELKKIKNLIDIIKETAMFSDGYISLS